MKQNTNEWNIARANKITGSIAGSILFDYPNKRSDVMRSMVRAYHGAPEEIDPFLESTIFPYGKFYETQARIDFEIETGIKIQECGFFKAHGYDWLGASPDGLIDDDAIAEIKCPWSKRDEDTKDFDSIYEMPHYMAQLQLEMLSTGRKKAYFYQWSQYKTKLEIVDFDPKWIEIFVPQLHQFYLDFLEEREHSHAQKHLEPKKKEYNSKAAKLLVKEYEDLQEAIERATERKKEVLQLIIEHTGGNIGIVAGKSLSYVEKQGQISYANIVKKEIPIIVEQRNALYEAVTMALYGSKLDDIGNRDEDGLLHHPNIEKIKNVLMYAYNEIEYEKNPIDIDLDKYRGKPSNYWVLK